MEEPIIEKDEKVEEATKEGMKEVAEEATEEPVPEETEAEKPQKKRVCSLCGRVFFEDEPAVLAVGGFGNHRYLCRECSDILDLALESDDPEVIEESITAIGETLARGEQNDEVTLTTLNDLLKTAAERKKQIEDGTYVERDEAPEAEEESGEEFEEVPEDLRETEEDRLADEKDKEAERKFNRVWNYVSIGLIAAAVVFIVLKFFVL